MSKHEVSDSQESAVNFECTIISGSVRHTGEYFAIVVKHLKDKTMDAIKVAHF